MISRDEYMAARNAAAEALRRTSKADPATYLSQEDVARELGLTPDDYSDTSGVELE